jgi:hypothetical protein
MGKQVGIEFRLVSIVLFLINGIILSSRLPSSLAASRPYVAVVGCILWKYRAGWMAGDDGKAVSAKSIQLA